MEQQAREQAFISALTTEQFVLQAARSANVAEMTGRGTIYMGTVSSALIAFGFLAQVVTHLDPFVAAVLPAIPPKRATDRVLRPPAQPSSA